MNARTAKELLGVVGITGSVTCVKTLNPLMNPVTHHIKGNFNGGQKMNGGFAVYTGQVGNSVSKLNHNTGYFIFLPATVVCGNFV
jgi:hypothetical protein